MAVVYGTNIDFKVPSLDLRFADRKNLVDTISGRNLITFSRDSIGTYVDGNGVIQSAASGEARFDHDPVTGESLGLLVEESRTNEMSLSVIRPDNNGIYTQWTPADGATIQPYAALAPDGTFTAALVTFPNSGVPKINRQTAVVSGTRIVSCWIRAKTGTVTIRVGTNSDFGQNQTVGTEWTRLLEEVPSSSNFAGIYCSNPVSSAEFYVWGAQVEAGTFPTSYIPTPATFTSRSTTATYYDANGVIQTAAIDEARDDAYFPDENGNFISAGLLLEESRTNLQYPSIPVVGSGAITVTPNAAVAPDGTMTATFCEPSNASSGIRSNGASFTKTAGEFYAHTFYFKPNGYNVAGIDYSSGNPDSYAEAWIDVTTNLSYVRLPLSNASGFTSIQSTPIANGWYEITAIQEVIVGGSSQFWGKILSCRPDVPTGTNQSYTHTSGAGGYFWGHQEELGAFPTSYIPTSGSTVTRAADVSTSASVTRAADVASITGTNFSSWYNQSEGTYFTQLPGPGKEGDARAFAGGLQIWSEATRVTAVRTGSSTNYVNVSYPAKAAAVYTDTECIGVGNGVLSANVGGVNSATSALYLGYSGVAGVGYLNNHISRLTYYPTRLSNALLQKLTK